jgi:branched-chain amino acid aminotransferase
MRRFNTALSVLKMSDNYTADFLQAQISSLLELNKISNGSVKIHISRNGSGKYLPESDHTNLFITTISGDAYKQNNAVSLCFYIEESKSIGSLSNIKSFNSLVSVLASIYANDNNFDSAILFNSLGNIIEVANANIFLVKNDKIYTPSTLEGCIDGTMREWICNELDIFEKKISKAEVLDADEVFIANAISGCTSVKSIEGVSFISSNIADSLQNRLFSLSSDL